MKGGHKQASGGKFGGAGAMEGFRRTNVFETPLNAVLDRMRAVLVECQVRMGMFATLNLFTLNSLTMNLRKLLNRNGCGL